MSSLNDITGKFFSSNGGLKEYEAKQFDTFIEASLSKFDQKEKFSKAKIQVIGTPFQTNEKYASASYWELEDNKQRTANLSKLDVKNFFNNSWVEFWSGFRSEVKNSLKIENGPVTHITAKIELAITTVDQEGREKWKGTIQKIVQIEENSPISSKKLESQPNSASSSEDKDRLEKKEVSPPAEDSSKPKEKKQSGFRFTNEEMTAMIEAQMSIAFKKGSS